MYFLLSWRMRQLLAFLCILSRLHYSHAQNSQYRGHDNYDGDAVGSDGVFTYPNYWPLTFEEGTQVNITWDTSYNRTNLFIYNVFDVVNSISLAGKSAHPLRRTFADALVKLIRIPRVTAVVRFSGRLRYQGGIMTLCPTAFVSWMPLGRQPKEPRAALPAPHFSSTDPTSGSHRLKLRRSCQSRLPRSAQPRLHCWTQPRLPCPAQLGL